MGTMTRRVFGITGWKNSGKTTLTERLVTELTRLEAGRSGPSSMLITISISIRKVRTVSVTALQVRPKSLSSPIGAGRSCTSCGATTEPSLETILARMSPCDIILVEGYKRGTTRRSRRGVIEAKDRDSFSAADPNIVAIAADHPVGGESVPVFELNDIAAIARFVEQAVRAVVYVTDELPIAEVAGEKGFLPFGSTVLRLLFE